MAAIPERLNSWIALGANVGVLVGLALLVVEINQNNVLVRAQIEQSVPGACRLAAAGCDGRRL